MKGTVLLIVLAVCFLSLFLYQKQMEDDADPLPQFSDQTEENLPEECTDDTDGSEAWNEGEEIHPDTQKKGHWETVIVSEPGWDESVLIKEGWTETILIKEAWDEEDTYCGVFGQDSYSGYECNCGKVSGTLEEVMKHVEEDDSCNSWHNKTIYYGEPYCQVYQTDYIHHDAQYRTIYHDPEYKIVHHEGKTYKKQVWVEE